MLSCVRVSPVEGRRSSTLSWLASRSTTSSHQGSSSIIQYLFINRLKPADLIVHLAGGMFEQKQPISEIASEGYYYVIRNKVSKHQAKGPPKANHIVKDSPPRADQVHTVFRRPDCMRRNSGSLPGVRPHDSKRLRGGLSDRHRAFGNSCNS